MRILINVTSFWTQECVLKNAYEKMNLENHRVNNLCLKSLYLGFILFLCFSIWTVIIMNIQWNLKEYPHNLTKYETNQTSNISISQLFIKLGKYWKCSIDLYSIFQILHELVRLRNPDNETFKNPKISLWPRKDSDIKHKTITQKITILNRCMNWEKLCPNLSFTFESKIRNLRRESYVLV